MTNITISPAAQAPAPNPVPVKHASEIRQLESCLLGNAIDIGRRLTICRELLKGGGTWRAWLQAEFGWSKSTAYNFIHIYDRRSDVQRVDINCRSARSVFFP